MAAGAIGRVTAALSSVYNENSVALANLNFDFTLFKFEAPREFSGIGSTMSLWRKENAESGPQHRTARKLGALFDGLLPSIPALLRMYGIRVSEIAQSEKFNAKSSKANNMFATHIGADSTSIWAAVTSGEGAVSVHLLACMLARAWTDSQATAIWVEIVAKRKRQILEESETAAYASKYDAALLAAQQDFTRAELSEWDNSARSWLQCGDLAMAWQHKHMTNVLDGANLPVNNAQGLYENVIKAWTDALKAMNNLICGTPQQVQNGAILLALSAWHLYPNLYILGASRPEIRQNDPLIGPLGVLTVGMENAPNSESTSSSVRWSLPLAYMSYYGNPQMVSQSVGHDNTRITMDQFAFILLGCIISKWKDFATDTVKVIGYVAKLSGLLRSWDQSITEARPPLVMQALLGKTSWLGQLLVAAEEYESITDAVERSTATKLINLGRRRGDFLKNVLLPPLFGLGQFEYLFPLLKGPEERIACLRQIALDAKLSPDQFVIRYRYRHDNFTVYEFATIRPLEKPNKPTIGFLRRSNVLYGKNLRWVAIHAMSSRSPCKCKGSCLLPNRDYDELHTARGLLGKVKAQAPCPCTESETECCTLQCHDWRKIDHDRCSALHCWLLPQRLTAIASLGEHCFPAIRVDSISDPRNGKVDFGAGNDFNASLRELYKNQTEYDARSFVELSFWAGDPETACIFTIPANATSRLQQNDRLEQNDGAARRGSYLEPEHVDICLNPKYLDFDELVRWFTISLERPFSPCLDLLRACASAAEIYKLLPDATVSTSVLSQTLNLAKWIPSRVEARSQPMRLVLSKAEVFACIAMFDSGTCNFDPAGLREVFAISSGNSIYVAGPLLCDPYEIGQIFEVRRIVGNIGRPGISLLVPPPDPKMLTPDIESWHLLNYVPFDGRPEDSFGQTSIHLSFTDYEMPLRLENIDQHIIDRPARLIETLVSVYDGQKWVADLNIMGCLTGKKITRLACRSIDRGNNSPGRREGESGCQASSSNAFRSSRFSIVSVDNWDEFLQLSDGAVSVVRAHRNWLARLAFTVASVQLGRHPVLLPSDACWSCCNEKLSTLDLSKTLLIM